jgi:hypothetical protein
VRAIDAPMGVGTTRAQQLSELTPQEMLEQFVVGVARPNARARRREEYANDRATSAAKLAASSRKRSGAEAPLCACQCGERVKACHNGVWSQYRGNHWRRRGTHATH